MAGRNTEQYGNYYWCVGLADAEETEVYLKADEVREGETGGLFFYREDGMLNLAVAPGAWRFVYAASLMDGAAVAVEHWPGQIIES